MWSSKRSFQHAAAAVLALGLVALAAACGSPSKIGQWYGGNTLRINLVNIQRAPELYYRAGLDPVEVKVVDTTQIMKSGGQGTVDDLKAGTRVRVLFDPATAQASTVEVLPPPTPTVGDPPVDRVEDGEFQGTINTSTPEGSLATLKVVPDGIMYYKVAPRGADNEFLLIRLDIRNSDSPTKVFINVDEKAMRLKSRGGFQEFNPINPLQQRTPVQSTNPEMDRFVPFIWGAVELPQQCPTPDGTMLPCRLDGWVVFEVPKGQAVSEVVWEAADTVFIEL